jgi:hypothetical protein
MERSVRTITVLAVGLILGLASCTSSAPDPSPTSTIDVATTTLPAATTTATTPATTTIPHSSTTTSTTTTAPPTTTSTSTTTTMAPPDADPDVVTNVTVSIGGGSGEVIVEWDRGSESDLDRYNVWYSLAPGGPKTHLDIVNHDPSAIGPPAYNAGSGRTAHVDFPRAQAEGTECYQVSAVDAASQEGARTTEACLLTTPPGAVSGFSVSIGGGSGEVFLTWARGPEPDIDHYNLWYSELPGDPKILLDSIAHDPGSLSAPAYNVGAGVTGYIDFPRDLTNDKQCYQISAVDAASNEGARTVELCLSGL